MKKAKVKKKIEGVEETYWPGQTIFLTKERDPSRSEWRQEDKNGVINVDSDDIEIIETKNK